MMKKILAVVMALAVMMTACTMMAFAAETPTDVEPEFVLKLDANTGDGKMDDIIANDAGVVVVPNECTFTKNNFNFVGWNANADGSGDAYAAGDEITLTEDNTEDGKFVLYAQWIYKGVNLDELEFTVTYDGNGATGEVVDEFNPYMEGFSVYTAYHDGFEKPGATFLGWNTEKDGSGTMYGEDVEFAMPAHDVVLYAIWEGGEEVPSEPEIIEPEVQEPVVTETDEENDNPSTGSASVAGAVVAGVVALGALVVLKKRD